MSTRPSWVVSRGSVKVLILSGSGTTLQQAYNQSVDDVFFRSQSYKF